METPFIQSIILILSIFVIIRIKRFAQTRRITKAMKNFKVKQQ